MTDSGLNHRLRQRSRRSGIMIGVSMFLTIAVCVASFTAIYAQLGSAFSDFISTGDRDDPTPTLVAEAAETSAPTEEQAAATDEPEQPTSEPTTAPQQSPTPNAEDFKPDYQIANDSVNFRSEPAVTNDPPPISALPFQTPLQYLDESQPTDNPQRDSMADGQVWMKFRLEDGREGWVRELDVEPYEPD